MAPRKENTLMTPDTIKRLYEERLNLVEQYRSLDAEAGAEPTAEQNAQFAKLDAAIRSIDERIKNGLDAAAREAEVRDAMQAAEKKGIFVPAVEAAERKPSFGEQLRSLKFGDSIVVPPERRDLVKGTNAAGGYLVPTSMYGRIVESLREVSTVVAANATVIETESGENITVPRSGNWSSASIVGEGSAISESDPSFDVVTLAAYKYGFLVQVSPELLTDSAFDVEAYVTRQASVSLAHGMGAHFVTGSGSGQPQGVTAATSGVTFGVSTITADQLIDLFHALTRPYRDRAVWVMRDSTAAAVRKLKDSTNQYLWQPGLAAGQPDLLLGRPVFTDPSVPAIGASAVSVVFGDMSGYFVRLAGGLRVERSSEYAFANDLVTYKFVMRADGKIVDGSAIRVGTHAAS